MKILEVKNAVAAIFSFLLVAQSSQWFGCRDSNGSADKTRESLPQIEAAVSRLLVRYQIDLKSIKTKRVSSGDGKFARIERRISVPPEFNSLAFNHDLSSSVVALGATVIATEKSEDRSVTMHIKKEGVILQSLIFIVTKKDN